MSWTVGCGCRHRDAISAWPRGPKSDRVQTRTQAGVRLERSRTSYEVDDGALAATTPVASLFGQHTRPAGRSYGPHGRCRSRRGGRRRALGTERAAALASVARASGCPPASTARTSSPSPSETPSRSWATCSRWTCSSAPARRVCRPHAAIRRPSPPSTGRRAASGSGHRPIIERPAGCFSSRRGRAGRSARTRSRSDPATRPACRWKRPSAGRGSASSRATAFSGSASPTRASSYTPGHGTTHLLEGGAIVFPAATLSVRIGATAAFGRRTTTAAGGFEWEACNLLDQGCEFSGSPSHDGEPLGATTLARLLPRGSRACGSTGTSISAGATPWSRSSGPSPTCSIARTS